MRQELAAVFWVHEAVAVASSNCIPRVQSALSLSVLLGMLKGSEVRTDTRHDCDIISVPNGSVQNDASGILANQNTTRPDPLS